MHPNDRLIALINHWHRFEVANPEAEIADFCRFYLAEQEQKKTESQTFERREMLLVNQLGHVLGRLSKFAQNHSKQMMAELGVTHFEDWLYLFTLSRMDTPKKSELIYNMLSDFTTGIEIIKRLLKSELVEEFPDPDDKRSKRLRATPRGREIAAAGYPRLAGMGDTLFAPLTEQEQHLTLMLLRKLDDYHTERWQGQRKTAASGGEE